MNNALWMLTAAGALGIASGLAPSLPPHKTTDSSRAQQAHAVPAGTLTSLTSEAKRGHQLFDHNCAPCHGDDARGDEGPTLYNLTLSDARITKRIKEGVKGEMPAFARKFTDADVQALIAYLRTLKD